MLNPVFVKGHLNFSIQKINLEFIHQNISTFGVTGLPWAPLNSKEHFGKEILVNVRIPSAEALSFRTQAYIMREYTLYSEHMGLKFLMDPAHREKIAEHIKKVGFYPTEYLRKYPRIPANSTIQTFPLRVLAQFDDEAGSSTFVMDVGNLSPNGILLYTENQVALQIQPGRRINLLLEPRGWFPMQIQVQGLVCRVVDELSPQSRNLIRYLGIKFSKVDDVNRTAFLDLLKDILGQIKPKAD